MNSELSVNRRDVLPGAIAFVGGAALVSCGESEIDNIDLHSGESHSFDADRLRTSSRTVDIATPLLR